MDLSVETDIAESTIRRIEAGYSAQLQIVHRLAKALGVPSQALHAPAGLLEDAGLGLAAGAYARRLTRP